MTRLLVAFAIACAAIVAAEDVPRGKIVDGVQCAANTAQTYVLYLPSNYNPSRHWNLILAFDPGGRGRRPVERYQAAAEKYGYIVVGSNNSRNGPWDVSRTAAQAMWADVLKRFSVDPRRVYAAGHSGGARVAMSVAMSTAGLSGYRDGTKYPGKIAGVFASSAFYPDNQPIKTLPFPVFGTAGTEDFNNLEMHQFDRSVTSPHRMEIFDGPHTWLPESLATTAVEWIELQAMKSGLRPRDDKWLGDRYTAWLAEAAAGDLETRNHTLGELTSDFNGLLDVTPIRVRQDALWKQQGFEDALRRSRAEQETEARALSEIADLEAKLDSDERAASLAVLRERLNILSAQAKAGEDSGPRRMARRILASVTAGSRGIPDQDYQNLVDSVRLPQATQR